MHKAMNSNKNCHQWIQCYGYLRSVQDAIITLLYNCGHSICSCAPKRCTECLNSDITQSSAFAAVALSLADAQTSGIPSAAATGRSVVVFSNPLEDDRRMTPEENTDFNNVFGFARKFALEDPDMLAVGRIIRHDTLRSQSADTAFVHSHERTDFPLNILLTHGHMTVICFHY